MKNPDALQIFSPEFFGGKFKSLKKQQQTDYFVKMVQRPSEYGNIKSQKNKDTSTNTKEIEENVIN
jgi:hypothetical protein